MKNLIFTNGRNLINVMWILQKNKVKLNVFSCCLGCRNIKNSQRFNCHTLLPSHLFKLSLSNWLFCNFPHTPAVYDINHMLFDCLLLSSERFRFSSLLHSLDITTDTHHQMLCSQSLTVILAPPYRSFLVLRYLYNHP